VPAGHLGKKYHHAHGFYQIPESDLQIMPPKLSGHPPTQEITALAVEECVIVDANSVIDGSTRLRRILLTGG